jgi:hypothetical protein
VSENESFIDEVTEEVRRDKLYKFLRRYGWIAFLIIFSVVGASAVWEYQKRKSERDAQILGDSIAAAIVLADSGDFSEIKRLSQLQEPGAVIASFYYADILVAKDRELEALSQYEKIYNESGAKKVFRDLAKFKAYFLVRDNYELAKSLLDDLTSPDSSFNILAQEQRALSYIDKNKLKEANDILKLIIENPTASNGIVSRAKEIKEALESVRK